MWLWILWFAGSLHLWSGISHIGFLMDAKWLRNNEYGMICLLVLIREVIHWTINIKIPTGPEILRVDLSVSCERMCTLYNMLNMQWYVEKATT